MQNLTPLLRHPLARARMARITAAIRAPKLPAHSEKPWWHDNEPAATGCAVALIPLSILLYVAGWAVIHFS